MFDQVKIDADETVGIVMFKAHEESLIDNLYAELFTEFTAERRYTLFTRFQFTAGEFPQAGE